MVISYWRKISGKLSSAYLCLRSGKRQQLFLHHVFCSVEQCSQSPTYLLIYWIQLPIFVLRDCKLANPLIITKLVIQLVKIRSRWAKMRDSFLVIIKGVIFAFFLFIYNTFWISKKNLATYTLQIFRNDICIFMRNSHLKEQWTGQKYRWTCMCIEARAHSLILKHSQYLILEPGLDKSVWTIFIIISSHEFYVEVYK